MKMNKLTRPYRYGAFYAAIITSLTSLSTAAFSANTQHLEFPSQVNWQSCHQEFGEFFECATVDVPLVHSRGNRRGVYGYRNEASIAISIVRVPAKDPDNKIGSLFLNPGGPGGSGVDLVLNAGEELYSDEVREKFDIVGFDPRGIARSNALSCFTSFEHLDELNQMSPYPLTEDDVLKQFEFDENYRKSCKHNAEKIIDYMTTADVARDMDILRQAVGDKQLTYAGVSYGSYLGVTYANLFPNKFRALIVDAVIDPIAWSTGRKWEQFLPMTSRLGSDVGAQDTLDEFFRLCDIAGPEVCGFSGQSAQRFAKLEEQLQVEPILLQLDSGEELVINQAFLLTLTLQYLYSSFSWEELAFILQFFESYNSDELVVEEYSRALTLMDARLKLDKAQLVSQSIEGQSAVLCSDSNNPRNRNAWPFAAGFTEFYNGLFGPVWTWISSECARWPGAKKSRYTGPFTKHTANPVLVMSTLFDPATRYEGAETVAKLMPNSHLVTVKGWGHATLFLSQCATDIASNYLLYGTVPENESVCHQDFPPFNLSAIDVFESQNLANKRSSEGIEVFKSSRLANGKQALNQEKREKVMRAMGNFLH